MPLAKEGLVHTPQAFVLNGLGFVEFPLIASAGANVPNTTVQASLSLPTNYKISKVAVQFSAANAVDGTHKFNIVIGGQTGATSQSYSGTAANDNSYTHSASNVIGTDSLGFPTNIASTGVALFASDVPFNPSDTTYGTANYATSGNGWIACATGGGYGVFVPTNYDAAYPIGVPISLRLVTPASTGSLSNVKVIFLAEPMGLRAGPPPSSTYNQATPGLDF